MEGRRSCACTAPPARAGGNGGRRRGGSGGGVLLAAGGAPPSLLLPCGLPLSLVPPFPRLIRARPVAESSCAGALSPRRSRCPPPPQPPETPPLRGPGRLHEAPGRRAAARAALAAAAGAGAVRQPRFPWAGTAVCGGGDGAPLGWRIWPSSFWGCATLKREDVNLRE